MTAPAKHSSSPASSSASADRYQEVRAATLALTTTLSAEDMLAQSMTEASPVKWHLAHTSWFFETFILAELPGHRAFDPAFTTLFNSYYNGVGAQHPRARRGLLTRPDLARVLRYRDHVDAAMQAALPGLPAALQDRVEIGLHHEQQHQELILTDVQHLLACNPIEPAFRPVPADMSPAPGRPAPADIWHARPGGLVEVGTDGDAFHFDNESPRHRVFLAPFAVAARPVDNAASREFIADGGYQRPELWLPDGWDAVPRHGWTAPLYWREDGETRFTLHGPRPIDPHAPVCHVSYYEADAFARWTGARLPTEQEWEHVAADQPLTGNFVESNHLEPTSFTPASPSPSFFGDVWVWTASPYVAYPGYAAPAGALGEYNGKFMCNQIVLRGGSCATPRRHIRASYRNFFPPETRWQFSGIRLAR